MTVAKSSGRVDLITAFVLACLFCLFFWLWTPGMVEYDTLPLIQHGLSGSINTHWSPFLEHLWGWLFQKFSSANGILVFQLLLLFFFTFVFVSVLFERTVTRICFAVGFLFSPVVFLHAPHLVRDIPFALVLCVLGATILAGDSFSINRWLVAAVVMILAFLAALLRQEGALVVLPFTSLFLFRVFVGKGEKRIYFASLGFGVAISIVLLLSASTVNYSLASRKDSCPISNVFIADLYLLSLKVGSSLFPVVADNPKRDIQGCNKVLQIEYFRRIYQAGAIFSMPIERCISQIGCTEIRKLWLESVQRYPGKALQVEFAKGVLLLKSDTVPWIERLLVSEAEYLTMLYWRRGSNRKLQLYDSLGSELSTEEYKALFRPPRGKLIRKLLSIYNSAPLQKLRIGFGLLILNLLVVFGLIISRRVNSRRAQVGLAFASSGLLHVLILTVSTPSHYSRLLIWFGFATMASLIVLCAQVIEMRRSRTGDGESCC